MRIAEVIGTVTLSRAHPSVSGFRWIVAVPFSLAALRDGLPPDGEDLVVYDDLGAGNDSRIGISEGGEAAVPFSPEKKPVDAYCACILDTVSIQRTPRGPGQ
ncbi:MAG: EutN/CcmL family microcompartment protein [Gemmataceae bacterium]|nr:EutN/CcmL family microcompartment protein [Gemmataceae bacterium]